MVTTAADSAPVDAAAATAVAAATGAAPTAPVVPKLFQGRLRVFYPLYRAFEHVNGVAHTHSRWATIWSQMGQEIPVYGTTHADYIYGPVPVTHSLTQEEVDALTP